MTLASKLAKLLAVLVAGTCAVTSAGDNGMVSPGWETGNGPLAKAWANPTAPVYVRWTPPGTGNRPNLTDWLDVLDKRGYHPGKQCLVPGQDDVMPIVKPVMRLPRAPVGSRRIAWFFILGYNPSPAYEDMVKSALLSARLKAPNLEPYFMYVMTPAEKLEYERRGGLPATELTKWMGDLGVRVKAHTVSFWDRPNMNKQIASGAQWGRLDLFHMAKTLLPEFRARGLLTTHVLYTDIDLFFAHAPPLPPAPGGKPRSSGNNKVLRERPNDPQVWELATNAYKETALRSCGSAAKVKNQPRGMSQCLPSRSGTGFANSKPQYDPHWPYLFAAGTEVFAGWALNSGVMYLNIENASRFADDLIDFAARKQFRFATADQMCIETFFRGADDFGNGKRAWDWLADASANSRGFLQPQEYMEDPTHSRAAVWHWHGYKADNINCLFRAIKEGTWDVTRGGIHGPQGEDEVPGCKIVKGNGKFPYVLTGCYLSTYAWMLNQHDRLQAIVDTMEVQTSRPRR